MVHARELRVRKRALLLAALAAAACMAAPAAPAEAHSVAPADWRGYVEAPKSRHVPAVEVTVLSGNVQNPQGIAGAGRGLTTLTVVPGGPPATVLLDYGKEVLGTPFIAVKSYASPAAGLALQLNFSERRQDLYSPGSSTLAAPAAAGSRTITVAAPSTFAIGDKLIIGGQTNAIIAIDGTTLSLAHRLTSIEPEGTAVTSTPGALTGDGVGLGGYSRPQSIAVTTRSQSSGTFEGGLRFETVTLSTPGTVTLSGAGIDFGAYLGTPDKYQGHFLSSSAALNTMWYDGAYTEQTDMVAPDEAGAIQPAVLDGAKRDRKIWSGDIAVEGPGILDSLGANGADYVKQSLLKLISTSTLGSGLAAFGTPTADALPFPPVYSNTYSSWTVDDATTYYRATGDTTFAKQVLPYLEGQLSYDSTLTDSAGLIVTTSDFGGPSSGLDWDLYDGPKAGTVASVNMLYYRILADVAYIESQLGDNAKAAAYLGTAAKVKNAINANLYDPETGAYDTSESIRGTIAQDANSFALLYGIAPQGDIAGIVKALKSLWGPKGSEPFSANADESQLISPYITAFEVEGLYQVRDSTDAEKLLALTWNQMIDPNNPSYTGTFWENYLPDGTLQESSISSAHGWSSGPTSTLSSYVLGVQPADPGYATFTVDPHSGTLAWASGAVPTPHGQITVSWTRRGAMRSLTVQVPPGTIGRIVTPAGITVSIQGGVHGVTKTLTLNP